jgi:hypothetical protein
VRKGKLMGKVLKFRLTDKVLKKRIERQAKREAEQLYKLTRGFQEPAPPTPDELMLFETGWLEL